MGGVLQVSDGEFVAFRSETAMVDFLLSLSGTVWGWNTGRFDTLWLAGHVRERVQAGEITDNVTIRSTGARIVLMTVGSLQIRDIKALVPLSLADAAPIGGTAKLKTGLRCLCGAPAPGCGGYCRIRRRMAAPERAALLRYLERDCRAAGAILARLQGYADAHDLDLRSTIGSSAWATTRRRSDLREELLSPFGYRFARQGYYGGRVQVFRARAEAGWMVDVTSAYPAALSVTALPVGRSHVTAGTGAERAFRAERPGIYQAAVTVPEMHVPPLPARDRHGRVRYPVGDLTGVWTRPELAYAMSLGVTVRSWGRAVVWARAEPVLADSARYIWSLRDGAGKKTPLGKWLKFYANSLTGKLAQSPEQETCFIVAPGTKPKECPFSTSKAPDPPIPHASRAAGGGDCWNGIKCKDPTWERCCNHQCSRYCGAWYPAAGSPTSGVWARKAWVIPPNGFVQWAAYLTATARIELHKQLVSDGQGGDTAVYCDTDSVFSTERRTYNIGAELGQWAETGRFRDFEGLAPKTYRYLDEDGKEVIAAKGIAEPTWNDLRDGKPTLMERGVETWKTAIQEAKLFRRKRLSRTLRHDGSVFGDRVLASDGKTHPRRMEWERPGLKKTNAKRPTSEASVATVSPSPKRKKPGLPPTSARIQTKGTKSNPRHSRVRSKLPTRRRRRASRLTTR